MTGISSKLIHLEIKNRVISAQIVGIRGITSTYPPTHTLLYYTCGACESLPR
jgi:hypothetical protein